MYKNKKVSVIIPALNEEVSLPYVLNDLPRDIVDEVIVVDNGSSDNTQYVAELNGAKVYKENRKGYGAACLKGLSMLNKNADLVAILDADYSDYPDRIEQLLQPLVDNYDMVLGSRILGNCDKGALTIPQLWGNALTTFLIKHICGFEFSDMGPFRAFKIEKFKKLNMSDKDFGWNVEMQMKALRYGLNIIEVPVDYRNRIGKSKISGTISGVIMAGIKIIYSVIKYSFYQEERRIN